VLPEAWDDALQKEIVTLVYEQPCSKHPQTLEFNWRTADGEKAYFLKVFHEAAMSSVVKNLFRPSKALRFWRLGLALSAAGFSVPLTVGIGELRQFRFVQRGFVLTAKVDGQSLPAYLASLAKDRESARSLALKRNGLARLARLIRQLHRRGFVHGDLVASNLFVAVDGEGEPTFHFMDNDRTHYFSPRIPQSLWKRNLVQLNRMPLPTITLQDRVRFLCAYLGRRPLSDADRQFARWIETQTRRRRHECDGADPALNFRKLMRWNSDVGANHDR
jgi:hypothetical protein